MIPAPAVIGVALAAVLAVWVLALFISVAVADTGYVGRHRGPRARKKKRVAKRRRGPSGPRSYHRTLGRPRSRPARRRQAAVWL